jgi:endonuclease YncB( thermonuclease family)
VDKFLVFLLLVSSVGLIIIIFGPSIYKKYSGKTVGVKKHKKMLAYQPAFVLIFLAVMTTAAIAWQDARNSSISSESRNEAVDYIRTTYPIYNNRYELAGVIDSNTVTINIRGEVSQVRLIGVEKFPGAQSPSQMSCHAKAADAKLTSYLKTKKIELEGDDVLNDKDKDGSLLRYAFVDDENINEKIIASGYAVASSSQGKYKYLSGFSAVQKNAKAKGLGLWAGGICNEQVITDSLTGSTSTSPSFSSGSTTVNKPGKSEQSCSGGFPFIGSAIKRMRGC